MKILLNLDMLSANIHIKDNTKINRIIRIVKIHFNSL